MNEVQALTVKTLTIIPNQHSSMEIHLFNVDHNNSKNKKTAELKVADREKEPHPAVLVFPSDLHNWLPHSVYLEKHYRVWVVPGLN